MKYGSTLLVSSGMGEFKCFFLAFTEDDRILALNRFGNKIIVSHCDILELFV